jgi:NRPS condensation-like uncharacterized protein/acyl carrier protein
VSEAQDATLATIQAIWREVLECPAHELGADSHFFLLGGDSLHLTRVLVRVRERLGVKLELRDAARFTTPRRMAACCSGSAAVVVEPAASLATEAPDSFTASEGQVGLWLAEQLSGNRGVYNTAAVVHLRGDLQVPVLQRALSLLLQRHEILRARFRLEPGPRSLLVQIAPQADVVLAVEHVSVQSLAVRLRELAAQPYLLNTGPLWRFKLFYTDSTSWHLLLGLHHSITDGWSGAVLLRELAGYYNRLCGDRHWQAPDIDREFRAWRSAATPDRPVSLAWWRAVLADADKCVSPLTLQSQRGPFALEATELAVPESLVAALESAARRAGVTSAALLLLATRLALHDLTGLRELCIAMPANLRSSSAQECGVGYFVNLLVLHECVDPQEDLNAALQRTQLKLRAALDNKELSYATLVRELRPNLLPSGNAWCDVLFAFHNLPEATASFNGLDARIETVSSHWGQHPLKFDIVRSRGGWHCRVECARTAKFGVLRDYMSGFQRQLTKLAYGLT